MHRREWLSTIPLGVLGLAGCGGGQPTPADVAPAVADQPDAGERMNPAAGVEVLLFDVFGTVVDWRGSLTSQFEKFGQQRALKADWKKLADGWQAAYLPSVDRVRKGERKFVSLEILRRESLDELLPTLGLKDLSAVDRAGLVRCWSRLEAWPDTVAALTTLKKRFPLVALSNGGFGLLLDMARHARLPWDAILSADLFRHFKTDAEVYRGAAELLARPARALMLVAAHNVDLAAARAFGFRTAYVQRPTEDPKPTEKWDIVARDFHDLAKQLGG